MSLSTSLRNQKIRWHELAHRLSGIGIFNNAFSHSGVGRPKIAVGVSGGPDSMALAYLLHHFELSESGKAYDVHAFIVDHGARDESRDEARLVRQNLEDLGIKSEILTIRWPQGVDPTTTSGFEEKARDIRYELIAHSALRHGCMGLFTGHHLDDNIETLIFRMARNKQHPLYSLRGMQGRGLIPCDHVFGIQGYSETSLDLNRKKFRGKYSTMITEAVSTGVGLYRPLLNFPKSRILATCSAYDIPYVDDKTNHDPKYAARNAIRHLRKFNLPRALQPDRLLSLQQRASNFMNELERSATQLVEMMPNLDLYSETGVIDMVVDIPPGSEHSLSWRYLMARCIELVAPHVDASFPALIPESSLREIMYTEKRNGNSVSRTSFGKTMIYTEHIDELTRRFIVQRQPLSQEEMMTNDLTFEPEQSPEAGRSAAASSKYLLWDGRFWIRIACADQNMISKISVRAYLPEDIKYVKDFLQKESRHGYKKLEKKLSLLLPNLQMQQNQSRSKSLQSLVRHTVPVLVYNDCVIAFPTLKSMVDRRSVPGLRWEVKYRRANRALDFFAANFQNGEEAPAYVGQSLGPFSTPTGGKCS